MVILHICECVYIQHIIIYTYTYIHTYIYIHIRISMYKHLYIILSSLSPTNVKSESRLIFANSFLKKRKFYPLNVLLITSCGSSSLTNRTSKGRQTIEITKKVSSKGL